MEILVSKKDDGLCWIQLFEGDDIADACYGKA